MTYWPDRRLHCIAAPMQSFQPPHPSPAPSSRQKSSLRVWKCTASGTSVVYLSLTVDEARRSLAGSPCLYNDSEGASRRQMMRMEWVRPMPKQRVEMGIFAIRITTRHVHWTPIRFARIRKQILHSAPAACYFQQLHFNLCLNKDNNSSSNTTTINGCCYVVVVVL